MSNKKSPPAPLARIHLVPHKFRPAILADELLVRSEAIDKLNTALRRKATLLVAAAGSGKSTLLAQWKQQSHWEHIAWLNLTPFDKTAARFFQGLAQAIDTAIPGQQGYHQQLFGQQSSPMEMAEQLLTLLEQLATPLLIVIDDVQWLTDRACQEAITNLTCASPDHIHWLVASRSATPLTSQNLQLKKELSTLDHHALSLSINEIQMLCESITGDTLSPELAEKLYNHTQGWLAGVKLALQSSKSSDVNEDIASLVNDLEHCHRDIKDYLTECVFNSLNKDTQDFLLATSILNRLNAELCDYLLDRSDSQQRLFQLESELLFLEPDDQQRLWYHYHSVFRSFLLNELLRSHQDTLTKLHTRAAEWLMEHQFIEEAINHMKKTHDPSLTAAMLERIAMGCVYAGKLKNLVKWTKNIPATILAPHKELYLGYLWALTLDRQEQLFNKSLGELEDLKPDWLPEKETELSIITELHQALVTDEVINTAVLEERLTQSNESLSPFARGTISNLLGYHYYKSGIFEKANRQAYQGLLTFKEANDSYATIYSQFVLSLVDYHTGDIASALERCQRLYPALAGQHSDPARAVIGASFALILYENNRLEEAKSLCNDLIFHGGHDSLIETYQLTYITLARCLTLSGNENKARQMLDYIHSVAERTGYRRVTTLACAEKINLDLKCGNITRARKLAEELQLSQRHEAGEWKTPHDYQGEWIFLGAAQALLLRHDQRFDECLGIISALMQAAQNAGDKLFVTILTSICTDVYWKQGDRNSAFEQLQSLITLAQSAGYMRSCLDFSPDLGAILSAAQHQLTLAPPLHDHLCLLLNISPGFDSKSDGEESTASTKTSSDPTPVLLDELTTRELHLLRAVADGLTNKKISDKLFISITTVKWHLRNIFSKLDVHHRTEAVAMARKMDLLG